MIGVRAGAGSTPARWNAAQVAGRAVWPLLGLVLAVVVWWSVTTALPLVHPAVLPPPADVLTAFLDRPAQLLGGMLTTTLETLVGFLLASVAGVLIGIVLATLRRADQMLSPLLVAINAVPKIAVAPLLVVALDFGQKPILTMVVLLAFFPIVLGTTTGLTTTPADLAELTRSLNASRWQTFVKAKFPAGLPHIFVGLKVAMPLAAIGAILGEFYASDGGGLGFQILQYSGVADTAAAWAAIILVGVMSIALYYALVAVEWLALPWVRETTSAR